MKILHQLPITPCAAPRLSRSDAWAPRPIAKKYFAFGARLRQLMLPLIAAQATGDRAKDLNGALALRGLEQRVVLPSELPAHLHLIFVMPMPASWSKKKREQQLGQPHRSTPDSDNLAKAFLDSLIDQDSAIWDIRATKIWGNGGSIVLAQSSAPKFEGIDLSIEESKGVITVTKTTRKKAPKTKRVGNLADF